MSTEKPRCRLCMYHKPYLATLFRRSLSMKVMELADVEVMENDGLPTVVCIDCENAVEKCYSFRTQIQLADKKFREEMSVSLVEVEECNIKEEHGDFMEDDSDLHSDSGHNDGAAETEDTGESGEKGQDEPVIPLDHVEVMETIESGGSQVQMIDDPQGQAEPLIEAPFAAKEEERAMDPLICTKEEDVSMEGDTNSATPAPASTSSFPVKRSMPASSFSISTSDNGSKNKSGLKTFLQNHQNNSTFHIESIQNSSSSTDFSTYKSESIVPDIDIPKFDHTGLTRLTVNQVTSCKNADVPSDLSVSLSNPLANPLGSLCKTSNKMLLILQLKPCSTPVNIKKVCESNISNNNSRPSTINQVNVKLKENKRVHENKSLHLRTENPACENLPQSKEGKDKSAVCKTDESNKITSGSFCRVCYVECGSLELLQEHVERKELMICRVCTAEFNSHKELETHFFTHKKYNCKVCQERFSDKKSLLDHRKMSDSCSYQEECKACGKQFFSRKYLDRHNLIFHNTRSDIFKCVVCGSGFILLEQLNYHLQTCHNAYVKVECSTCHKWYLGPEKLKLHVKAMHLDCNKERETVCSVCEKRFSNVQSLKHHMEIHDVTDCLCDICGKSVKGKSAMKRHMQYDHSRSGTFVCKICNQQFDMEVTLKRHRRKVHAKRAVPLPVFCEICGKEYKSKAILKRHRLTHFDEKPFKCEICGASFKQQGTRNTHRRVHNSEGKFRCNNCEMTFKWKHVYARHAKKCVGDG